MYYRSRSNNIFKNNDNKPFNNYNYKKKWMKGGKWYRKYIEK